MNAAFSGALEADVKIKMRRQGRKKMGGRLDRKIGKNQGREKMPKREVAHIEKKFFCAPFVP